MMRIFLDTSILIDILKGSEEALEKVERLRHESEIFSSSINVYEIMRGIMLLDSGKKRHIEALETLLSNITVLPVDTRAAEKAAEIYAALRKVGKPANEVDYIIGGVCLSNGIGLIISRNGKHFEHMSPLLKVESY